MIRAAFALTVIPGIAAAIVFIYILRFVSIL